MIVFLQGIDIADIQLGAVVNNIPINKGCCLLHSSTTTFKVIVR